MFCLLNGDLYCLLCVAKCVFLKCGLDIWQQASVQQCAKCSGGVYCKASSCKHPVRCHVLGSRYGVYCKATSCKQPLHCKMLRCRYGGYCKAMQCKQPLHCGFATLRPWCVCVCLCVCVLQGDCLHTASALSDVELPYDIIQLYAAPCGELTMKLSYHINMQTK